MIDPQKKARDADRDAAIEVVEAAFVDGQITAVDRDLRVERLLQASTLGDVETLVRDLQPAPGVSRLAPLAPQPPATLAPAPGVSRLASLAPQPPGRRIGLLIAVIGVVVALLAVIPLVIFASVDGGESFQSSEGVEVAGEEVDLTSAEGYDALVAAVKAKTGSTTVFDVTVYPGYAVVTVPVDRDSQRSFGYYFDGDWQEWTGSGTSDEERFDLRDLDGATVASVVRKARRQVDSPDSYYYLVNPFGREESVCLSAYATNEYDETAYLDATCDGEVVRTYRN